ncbi:MAG TPA: hypothetical protein VEI73_12825 [Candidatus Acidoferrum sp.]|nr:hypothetical protein [Candidatus Acidoferrum sp.]
MDRKTKVRDKLQNIHAALSELLVELEHYDLEQNALGVLRNILREMLATVRTLGQGIDRSSLAPGNQAFLALLIDEQMRRASQLNTEIGKDFEAGKIKTDQEGLSGYLLALNQVIEQLDVILGSRGAGR